VIKSWPLLETRSLGDFRIFRLRSDRKLSPRTGEPHDFIVMDCFDWVNVIALTPDDHMILIEQFRHGTNTVELEIPGGVMDASDASPVATGIRELREETGYEGRNARLLGDVASNPAIMSNTCHTILIEACTPRHPVEFDSGEDLATRLIPIADIPALVAAGTFRHSLVVVALYYFDLWRRDLKRAPNAAP
jgi:8-oxo-dGTP pyrophosphatase MutT (NUDIX family)